MKPADRVQDSDDDSAPPGLVDRVADVRSDYTSARLSAANIDHRLRGTPRRPRPGEPPRGPHRSGQGRIRRPGRCSIECGSRWAASLISATRERWPGSGPDAKPRG